MPDTKPHVLLDTCVVVDLGEALAKGDIPASRALGGKDGPVIVLTESVGKELFGKNGFSLSGGDSVVQSVDTQGHLKLKPLNEVMDLVRKNGNPTRLPDNELYSSIEHDYTMLNDLAKQDRLMGVNTGAYGATPDPGGKRFSGLKKDSGERSIAAADAELRNRGKDSVFVVSGDTSAVSRILEYPGNEHHVPQIMNAGAFARTVIKSGDLQPSEQAKFLSDLTEVSFSSETDVISKGLLKVADPKKLQAAYEATPDHLAASIEKNTVQRSASVSPIPLTPEQLSAMAAAASVARDAGVTGGYTASPENADFGLRGKTPGDITFAAREEAGRKDATHNPSARVLATTGL